MLRRMGLNENCNNSILKRVCKFLHGTLEHSLCYYPDPECVELKKLLAKKFDISSENLFISNGSDEALLLILCVLKDVNTVICPKHTFNAYKYCAKLFDKKLIQSRLNKYTISISDIKKKLTQNSLVIIPNPHNPCGTYLNSTEINMLIKICKQKNAYLLIDEAYGEYAEREAKDYKSALNLEPYSKLIILKTFSKFYGLAGLRCGYIIANSYIIKKFNKSKKILVYNVNVCSQLAIQFVLKSITEKDKEKNFQAMYILKQNLYNFCDQHNLKYVKSVTNFVLVDVNSADDVYLKLMKKDIQTKSCSVFGYPQFLRITLSNEEDLKKIEKELRSLLKL